MKVIIAYDGSKYADAAIENLPRAGFPRDTEIMIASVADFSTGRPAVSEFDMISAASRRIDTVLEQARRFEAHVLKDSRSMTSKVVHGLRRRFPGWKVNSEILTGNPTAELLRKVDDWNADLIMGGSHGRSAIGRFFLGSVSRTVAEKAASSVRVVRRDFEKAKGDPIEIILGATNAAEAELIVDAVGRRVWPADTRLRLIAVDDGVSAGSVAAYCPDGKSIYETAAERLASVGLTVSVQICSGDPKTIFLQAADAWGADAIFVASGHRYEQGLDEISLSLITNAKCTIEIVR